MAIVINEFEVMVEPPPSPQPEAAARESRPPQAQAMRPDEIVTILQVHEERMQRLRAN